MEDNVFNPAHGEGMSLQQAAMQSCNGPYRRSGNFRRYPTTTKIKIKNIFQHRIIRMKLHFRYAEATKIQQRENLTDEYFMSENFSIYGIKVLKGHPFLQQHTIVWRPYYSRNMAGNVFNTIDRENFHS